MPPIQWLTVLGAGAVATCIGSLGLIALGQARRSRRLARRAHEIALRFSYDDLFDVPRRYGTFCLMQAGHSSRAHNLIYGRRGSLPVRAFDFHYEIGHGTTRTTRRYWVVIVEMDQPLAPVILWNRLDGDLAPLEARLSDVEVRDWSCRGSLAAALAVCPILEAVASSGASLQSCGQAVMLCLPAHRKMLAEASQVEIATAAGRVLADHLNPPGNLPHGNVANVATPC
jgi:hypothetical protein